MVLELNEFDGISFGNSNNALEISNFIKSCEADKILVIDTLFSNGYVESFHIQGHDDIEFVFNSSSISSLYTYAVIRDENNETRVNIRSTSVGLANSSYAYLSCILWYGYGMRILTADQSKGGRDRLFSKDNYNAKYINYYAAYSIKTRLFSYNDDCVISTIYGYYNNQTGYILDNGKKEGLKYSNSYYPLNMATTSYNESRLHSKIKNIVPLMCNAGYFKDSAIIIGAEENYAGVVHAILDGKEVTLKNMSGYGYISLK